VVLTNAHTDFGGPSQIFTGGKNGNGKICDNIFSNGDLYYSTTGVNVSYMGIPKSISVNQRLSEYINTKFGGGQLISKQDRLQL